MKNDESRLESQNLDERVDEETKRRRRQREQQDQETKKDSEGKLER